MVTVVIAGDGPLAAVLADWYRKAGADVAVLSFNRALEPQADAIAGGIDLLVLADSFEPEPGSVDAIDREALRASMRRLTFLPFRVAALLQPKLVAANGRAVLLSRSRARMEIPDGVGRYLDRPFRAACHALFRCLSIEWRDAGVSVGLIAVGSGATPSIAALAHAIDNPDHTRFPVELTDISGNVLGW